MGGVCSWLKGGFQVMWCSLSQGDEVMASSEGKFSNADFSSGELVNLTFKTLPKLEVPLYF